MGKGRDKSDDRRICMLAYLSFEGVFNSIEMSELLKASSGTVSMDKQYLFKHGLVIRIGGKRSGYYKLTELGERCLHYESLEFIEGV